MNRVNAILAHPRFRESLEKTVRAEEAREFCGHGLDHLIDTARIAYILSLESGWEMTKETVYAAALLHDAGRWRQYLDGTPHEEESARIAASVLPDCGFFVDETELITGAILAHRTAAGEPPGFLPGILYRADKLSRRCYECEAADRCDWDIKNPKLEY